MAFGERHQEIQELVHRQGFVSIESLAQHFDVTPQTIRRDINILSRQGLLRRYHGGAGLPSSVENVAYATRQVICLEEKRRIARLVAEHIPDEASLFLNIGTTTEEVARALTGKRGLRVITNNLNVAAILAESESAEVTVAGGLMRKRDRAIIGEATINFIGQFKVDYGVIGISAIDPDGTLLDFDFREVQVSKAIIESARHVFLVTDHTKFSRSALVRLGDVSLIDAIFTDQPLPASLAARFAETEIAVHVAPPIPQGVPSQSQKALASKV
ncbi:MAG: DeoR/GlpR family DNA-binding transcription regulator [Kiloniellales bacterium]